MSERLTRILLLTCYSELFFVAIELMIFDDPIEVLADLAEEGNVLRTKWAPSVMFGFYMNVQIRGTREVHKQNATPRQALPLFAYSTIQYRVIVDGSATSDVRKYLRSQSSKVRGAGNTSAAFACTIAAQNPRKEILSPCVLQNLSTTH